MTGLISRIDDSAKYIKVKTKVRPTVGLILGTGLGELGKQLDNAVSLDYSEIPHFPVTTVESHKGRLLLGGLGGRDMVVMQGRFHYYEGYTFQQVAFPVRVMKALGIETLILTNISGGVNPQFDVGDIILITDHINLMGGNPLVGPNHDGLGPRFPDMHNVYDKQLGDLAESTARECEIPLQKGVYLAMTGPGLETAAEYRMVRLLGADIVGMSTVPEAIVARHQGTRVMGLSLITDTGYPYPPEPCGLEDVLRVADQGSPKLRKLIVEVLKRMTD